MSRYPNEDIRRFDQQFAESPAERVDQRNKRKLVRLISQLDLIADLAENNRPHQEILYLLRESITEARKP